MKQAESIFWLAVIVGFVVMLVLFFLPVINYLVGGFVAGILARGGTWNGAKVGFMAGIIGAVIIGAVILLGGTIFLGLIGFLGGLVIAVVLLVLGLMSAILGLVGGAIGGTIAK